VRCFENVAAHLTDDGAFVIEAYVPYVARDQHVKAEVIEVERVTLDVGRLDPVKQLYYESHVVLSREGVRLFPIVQRYAWPSELDLMARIAGLRLKERWANWTRQPFTADSWSHVSVYGR
jgi:hypothetical protein